MNIKEIAKLTGKSRRAVEYWASKCDKSSHVCAKIAEARTKKRAADFTLEETIAIIRAGGNDTLADLLHENATSRKDSELTLTKRDISVFSEAVSMTIARTIEVFGLRPAALNPSITASLPPAPKISERDRLNRIIRAFVSHTGISYSTVWGKLYDEMYYRLKRNVTMCASNRNIPVLDYIEQEGLISAALAIAEEIFSVR